LSQMMYGQRAWVPTGKTSSSAPLREEELAFLLSASQGIELPYTVTMTKRKRMQQERENLSCLLNKIGPSPW